MTEDWVLKVGEPITGWREWRVETRHGVVVLVSVYFDVSWPRRREMIAHCYTRDRSGKPQRRVYADHEVPAPSGRGCGASSNTPGCGIYALKSYDLLLERAQVRATDIRTKAAGEVLLWGKIRQYDEGYRAQFAYPKSLVISADRPFEEMALLREQLEEKYGVPVEIGFP